MLLQAAHSQLIVVDTQERLMPAIGEAESVLRHVAVLLKGAVRLNLPVTVTEQYPKGLGPTVAAVRELLPDHATVLTKTAFSALREPAIADHVARLRAEGRHQAVVCGAEAHVCVLQTALDLKAAGFDVFVVGDAVSSRSPHSVRAAHARMLHAGCTWVTTEMAIFEWLERAATEEFRALSALIKDLGPTA